MGVQHGLDRSGYPADQSPYSGSGMGQRRSKQMSTSAEGDVKTMSKDKENGSLKMDQHCALCFEVGVSYVKTKGGFHKLCDSCWKLVDDAGLTVPCDIVRAI
jgi:hypothetical protein